MTNATPTDTAITSDQDGLAADAILVRLKTAGLRPTRQRIALAELLFSNGNRHLTAEQLHGEAMDADVSVSLATVYNTLHQFTAAGLLREVVVEAGRSYFDTNTTDHHHVFVADQGDLSDIDGNSLTILGLPQPAAGCMIERVDVIVRVRSERS